MSVNIKRIQERLSTSEVPSVLLTDLANVQWATGFTGSSAFILMDPNRAVFITDSRYSVQSREQVSDCDIEIYASPITANEFIAQQASKLGFTRMGFEAAKVNYATYSKLKEKLGGIDLVPLTDVVEPLRLIKSKEEIEAVKRACKLADACFEHVVRLIQPGVREYDIALDIEFFFRRQGAELAFSPIVVSGERSARPHGVPSEKALERGDFVTMDFGARVNGYCSDMTRTVVVEHASDRHQEVYGQVLKAQVEAIKAMRPGPTAGDIDRLSRQILDEKGLAHYFGHGLGHGLGSAVHDGGSMNSTSTTVLEPGQVWTVEPGVYIEGFGGVRIEDDVVVTESGVEVLTHSPKELLILPNA